MNEAAKILGQARRDKTGVSLAASLVPTSEDEAYGVQAALHAWQLEQGQGAIAGYKIGCTTPVMQEIVGVPSPVFGGVLDSNVYQDEAALPFADFQQVGIECEIAVQLAYDLAASDDPYDREQIEQAIGACRVAIEIVDNRYGDFLSLPAPLLVADDFFQSACVLGPQITDWRGLDLAAVEGRTFVNGKFAGSGPGLEVLGHPLEAVVWIANRLSGLGRGLKAGQFILTGSLVAVQWLDATGEAVVSIDGLGDVRATFS
jgi:2-keto-4-pentenoate hydratase